MPSTGDIEAILRDMRSAIETGKFQPISRRKNVETLSLLGLTWDDAKDEIYTLTTTEYYQGPMIDRDYPDSDRFWVFKKTVDGHIIYIKFKVLYQVDSTVKLVSFHIDYV